MIIEELHGKAREIFDDFNALHFGGALAPIPIDFEEISDWKGALYYKPSVRMVLALPFLRQSGDEGLRQVILHEMIHYFFHFKEIKDTSSPLLGHSVRFREMANKVGLTLLR